MTASKQLKVFMLAMILSGDGRAAVVIDRIAVVVGKHVIKLSDIDRDLRLTAFLNRQVLKETADEARKAADRLIDQQIIRNELASGGYERATDADADALLREIRQNRYGGLEMRLKEALTGYGLTEDQLRAQLLWQLTVLGFIEQRFSPGVLVTDEEVRAWYEIHPEVQKASFEAAAPQIRKNLEGEQVNSQFEAWLDAARKLERVEFREGAFGGSSQ
jgi:hypothetical protein